MPFAPNRAERREAHDHADDAENILAAASTAREIGSPVLPKKCDGKAGQDRTSKTSAVAAGQRT